MYRQGSQETRMMAHSDGRKGFQIGLAVLIQYWSVTDSQPATQPARHVGVAVGVAITVLTVLRR